MTKRLPQQSSALGSWIQEAMMDTVDGQSIKMMACVHKEGSRDVEVFSVTFEKEKGWDPNELSEIFRRKAESHVAEIPGSQLFYLYAFYGEDTEPGQRRSFRVNNSDVDFGYGGTEPPTPQGGMMQSMRHNEMAFQTNMRMMQFLMEQSLKQNQLLAAQNATLMIQNKDALEMAQRTILERATFEAQKLLEEAKREERKEFIKMIPPLVNRALGRDVFPIETADTKLIETIISKLDQETVNKLSTLLPPEIMGLIAGRAKRYHEEKNRAVSTAERALTSRKNGSSEPEDIDGEIN